MTFSNGFTNERMGLVGAVLVHMALFAVPVSTELRSRFQDAELFVLEEKTIQTGPMQNSREAKVAAQAMPPKTHVERCPVRAAVLQRTKPSHLDSFAPAEKSPEKPAPQESDPALPDGNAVQAVLDPGPAAPVQVWHGGPGSPAIPATQTSLPQDNAGRYNGPFGSASGPGFLHREWPSYPMPARRLGKEGRVILRLTIDETGHLQDIEVIKDAGYGLTEAAIAAVRKSAFTPAKNGGRSVASRAILPVVFRLRRD